MFYTYVLKSSSGNIPFYVGKGKGLRANFHVRSAVRDWASSRTGNVHKFNTIRKIVKDGFEIFIELKYFNTEKEAFTEEIRLIGMYGLKSEGGILTNLTRGGEGYTRPGIKVDQYSILGEYIQTFESIQDASQVICGGNNSKNAIKECCDGIRRSSKGFMWSYHGRPVNRTKSNKIRSIGQFKDDKLIARFSSINEAARIGFDASSISLCCRGKYRQHKGYVWQFI